MTDRVPAPEEQPKCHAQPSPRSTARCEMPPGHESSDSEFERSAHAGRTRGGYWKFWQITEGRADD